jgi:hypothetical protein
MRSHIHQNELDESDDEPQQLLSDELKLSHDELDPLSDGLESQLPDAPPPPKSPP